MISGRFLWGLANGITVLAIAGAFWLGVGLGPGMRAWPWAEAALLATQIGTLAGFFLLAHRLRRRSGFSRADLRRDDPDTRRILKGFRAAAVLEFALVAAAVWLCRIFQRPDLLWPAIALAISAHFVPLARLFGMPEYHATAGIGAAIALLLLLGPPGDWRMRWLGAAMACLMWIVAAYLLARADQLAARAVRQSTSARVP